MFSKSILTSTNTGMQKVIFYSKLLKQVRCLNSGSDFLFHPYGRCIHITFQCYTNSNCNCRTWHREEPSGYRSFSTLCKQSKNLKQVIKASSNLSSYRQQHSYPEKESSKNVTSKNYDALYFIQHIRLFRILGNLAKVSMVIASFGCPLSLCLYYFGSVTYGASIATALALNSFFFLLPSITFISRVVCKIMISEDNKSLKISHMSVFGQRRDIYVQPQDVIVDFNPQKKQHLLIKKIKLRNVQKTLLFFPTAGDEYTDFHTLEALFSRDATLKKD